jgi:hypothetical protein
MEKWSLQNVITKNVEHVVETNVNIVPSILSGRREKRLLKVELQIALVYLH